MNMYSLHGFEELIGAVFGQVCQRLDRIFILNAGVAAEPGSQGDLVEQHPGLVGLHGTARSDRPRDPFLVILGPAEEGVTAADRQVGVLKHDRAISFAVEVGLIALAYQGLGLGLFLGLALDELEDVGMPALERLHLGRAAGLAARLDDAGDRVVDPHEADRAGRFAAAGEFLLAGAESGKIGASSRAKLEQHGLAMGQVHDAFHVVVDTLDEAGRRLGRLVGAGGPSDRTRLFIPPPVVGRSGNSITVVKPDVEPDRGIERAVLIDAQGCQLVVEPICILGGGEIAVVPAPVGDRPGHAVDELANRVLALAFRGTAVAAGHVAVKVLADHHVGGKLAPVARNLAIDLLEDHPPPLVLDLRGSEDPSRCRRTG